MKSPITIDFVNSIIIVNAAYAKKASNPFSQEYEQLQRVRADYPTYAVITRTIKKNSEKESYKGLTYDYMRAYIITSNIFLLFYHSKSKEKRVESHSHSIFIFSTPCLRIIFINSFLE